MRELPAVTVIQALRLPMLVERCPLASHLGSPVVAKDAQNRIQREARLQLKYIAEARHTSPGCRPRCCRNLVGVEAEAFESRVHEGTGRDASIAAARGDAAVEARHQRFEILMADCRRREGAVMAVDSYTSVAQAAHVGHGAGRGGGSSSIVHHDGMATAAAILMRGREGD